MSAADDKMTAAIRDMLWRSLDMVEQHSTIEGALIVRRVDVRNMLTNIAGNLAMMFREAMQSMADGATALAQDATHEGCAELCDRVADEAPGTQQANVAIILASMIRLRKRKAIELRAKVAP